MSTITWFTSGGGPHQIVSDNSGYLYVSLTGISKIGKISLTNPSTDYNLSWATVTGNQPNGLFIYQGYIYSLNNNNNTISRFSLTNPSTDFNLNWATNGMSNALGVFIYNGYIYVANNTTNKIGKISLTSPNTDYNASWVSLTEKPWVITLYNNYMYVAFVDTNKIGKISFTDPVNDRNESWATTGSGPIGLAIYGNYIYVSNNNGYIGYNNLTNPNTDSSNSWVTIGAGSGPLGITVINNYLYSANNNIGTISKLLLPNLPPPQPTTTDPPCFLEGTQILTDKGYRPIQNLRKGDLVKTRLNGFLPIAMIGKKEIVHPASQERIKEQLYQCSTAQYPELTEDLVITGCHCILIDEFQDEKQRAKTLELMGDIFITEDQYRLPACLDDRATMYEKPGSCMIYHLALMNNSWYANYGIYANGLLVESCSKRYLQRYSGMELF